MSSFIHKTNYQLGCVRHPQLMYDALDLSRFYLFAPPNWYRLLLKKNMHIKICQHSLINLKVVQTRWPNHNQPLTKAYATKPTVNCIFLVEKLNWLIYKMNGIENYDKQIVLINFG